MISLNKKYGPSFLAIERIQGKEINMATVSRIYLVIIISLNHEYATN